MMKDIFFVLYGGVAALNVVACIYLLFRRSNAIAPDITSSERLRRWTAIFFATLALSHLWNFPVYVLSSIDDVRLSYLVGGLLDCMTIGPMAIVILFVMLQDRKRPLWPVALLTVPFVVLMALCVGARSQDFLPILYACFILLAIGLTLYMVLALKQYGRWLRDNYSDLEHKEVWQSFVVLAFILSGLGVYTFDVEGLAYQCFLQIINIVLVCYLLWRVETLSDLKVPLADAVEGTLPAEKVIEADSSSMRKSPEVLPCKCPKVEQSPGLSKNIGPLLKQYCEDPQLYLNYDISITQLAQQIGINRSYLSRHFTMQGTNYNAYINGLRIRHFINLYHQSTANHQPITAQQLAFQSGFRSYSTFSAAFKQVMGMTATEWMRLSE
ncbi:MAG: AraC family transcriptional regulator [Prevotella sp.]|nr:AraC family transcriptional regulator [Prevotella sp.]